MIKDIWDRLKQYIDYRLGYAKEEMSTLFNDYKVKDVGTNIEAIKNVSGKYVGSGDSLPSNRRDGSDLQYGDLFELNNQLMIYTQYNGWVNISNLGQYVDSGTDLGHSIMYTANKTAQNEEIVVKSGWNAFSVDNLEIDSGTTITIQDNATYKVI